MFRLVSWRRSLAFGALILDARIQRGAIACESPTSAGVIVIVMAMTEDENGRVP